MGEWSGRMERQKLYCATARFNAVCHLLKCKERRFEMVWLLLLNTLPSGRCQFIILFDYSLKVPVVVMAPFSSEKRLSRALLYYSGSVMEYELYCRFFAEDVDAIIAISVVPAQTRCEG